MAIGLSQADVTIGKLACQHTLQRVSFLLSWVNGCGQRSMAKGVLGVEDKLSHEGRTALQHLRAHKRAPNQSVYRWLDAHREDVLVVWENLACSGAAMAMGETPAELTTWRELRNIPLPRRGDEPLYRQEDEALPLQEPASQAEADPSVDELAEKLTEKLTEKEALPAPTPAADPPPRAPAPLMANTPEIIPVYSPLEVDTPPRRSRIDTPTGSAAPAPGPGTALDRLKAAPFSGEGQPGVYMDDHKADIAEALETTKISKLAPVFNMPEGTLYGWATRRGFHQRQSRGRATGSRGHVAWLDANPQKVQEALKQTGTVYGGAKMLGVPEASLRWWMQKRNVSLPQLRYMPVERDHREPPEPREGADLVEQLTHWRGLATGFYYLLFDGMLAGKLKGKGKTDRP